MNMNRVIAFFGRLLDSNDTSNSTKSFALLVSTLTGGFISLCIGFSLLWDVVTNGSLKSDLSELGWFTLCVGGYIAGSGITKTIVDSMDKRNKKE